MVRFRSFAAWEYMIIKMIKKWVWNDTVTVWWNKCLTTKTKMPHEWSQSFQLLLVILGSCDSQELPLERSQRVSCILSSLKVNKNYKWSHISVYFLKEINVIIATCKQIRTVLQPESSLVFLRISLTSRQNIEKSGRLWQHWERWQKNHVCTNRSLTIGQGRWWRWA